jgi:HSP20 family protein
MAIMRWDPFGEVTTMQRDVDRLLGRLGMWRPGDELITPVAWMPRIDVKTVDHEMVVLAELPGVKQEDIDIEVTDDVLTIKGERKAETETNEAGWLIQERSYGSFERSLSLPEGVKQDKITADFHDGVLEVHVPQGKEALKPRTHRIALGAGKK